MEVQARLDYLDARAASARRLLAWNVSILTATLLAMRFTGGGLPSWAPTAAIVATLSAAFGVVCSTALLLHEQSARKLILRAVLAGKVGLGPSVEDPDKLGQFLEKIGFGLLDGPFRLVFGVDPSEPPSTSETTFNQHEATASPILSRAALGALISAVALFLLLIGQMQGWAT